MGKKLMHLTSYGQRSLYLLIQNQNNRLAVKGCMADSVMGFKDGNNDIT